LILNRDLEFAIVSPYLDKKSKIKNSTDYKTFYWEVETPEKERVFKTPEQLAAIWQKKQTEKE